MQISLTQVEATRNGTLEEEKRDHAVAKALGPPAGAKYTYAERRTAAQTLPRLRRNG